MVSFDNITKQLSKAGITPSVQRIKILEYLNGCNCHPTADLIFNELREAGMDISLATVYNTLKTFEEKKLIRVLAIEGKENRFDIMTHDHGHFICSECGSIMNFDINCENVERIEDECLPGFHIKQKDIYFRGVCTECLKNT